MRIGSDTRSRQCAPIRRCFVRMSNPAPRPSQAFGLTVSALVVNCGATRLPVGRVGSSGHRWWIDRFRTSRKLFDRLRLDHFRGFEAFWEVPVNGFTAQAGKWVKGPGAAFFFRTLKTELKELPFVAENLELRSDYCRGGSAALGSWFPGNEPASIRVRERSSGSRVFVHTTTHANWWSRRGARQ